MKKTPKISIIGLGYVGLPLAIQLAKHFSIVGFDTNGQRVRELQSGHDRTNECDKIMLSSENLIICDNQSMLKDSDIYIITVPTPVNDDNSPDLTALLSATNCVASVLKKNNIVVYESTVYPGITENVCGATLEKLTKMKSGKDFFLGYAPERINPGDKKHTLNQITKIVSGQTPKITNYLKYIYGLITTAGVFAAKSIQVAEAAKVIENSQRDINIAFMNEISVIFNKLGLNTHDVLEAAKTKWNFLPFEPGLVGGHCIGVDPFYLAHAARQANYIPEIILAGRRINDKLSEFIGNQILQKLPKNASSKILVLGLSFKENVPDIRNSKVVNLIFLLEKVGHHVSVHDPIAKKDDALNTYGIELLNNLKINKRFDCVIGAVAHKRYQKFKAEEILSLINPNGLLVDLKGMWRNKKFKQKIKRWEL